MGKLLTTEDVAVLLNSSTDHVRRLVAEGRLQAVRIRPKGQLRFHEADVMNALQPARIESAQTSAGALPA